MKMTVAVLMSWITGIVMGLTSVDHTQAAEGGKAVFKDAKGNQIGTARLTQTPNGVLIEAVLSNLPSGEHAFHIHQIGRCDVADGFKSAGGHYSPSKREHGFMVDGGPHAGDMPNQFVSSDGTLQTHVANSHVSLVKGKGSLFKSDGTALVIHAKADDYRSQPSGDAGDRIACAVIEPGGG